MSASNLTHKDIASELGIAEATVKSYRRAFPQFFELRHAGKPLRYAPSALDVCRIIRDGRKNALSEADIRERLQQHIPLARQSPPPTATASSQTSSARSQSGFTSDQTSPAVEARIQEVLELVSETQRQLLQIQGESAARIGAMQHRMYEALTLLQDRTAQQDTIIQTLTEQHHAILERLEILSQAWRELTPIEDHTERPAASASSQIEAAKASIRPDETGTNASRITHVAIRNAFGDVQRYTVATGPQAMPPEPKSSTDEVQPTSATSDAPESSQKPSAKTWRPDPDFLELPLVVRSELGEYLGVAGKALRTFSTGDLIELVEDSFPPPQSFHIRFEPGNSETDSAVAIWRLELDQESGQQYRLVLERTTTPRGNDVVVLTVLEVDGQEVPPPNLYLFIKQMLQLRTSS